jgi:hypothetical protein
MWPNPHWLVAIYLGLGIDLARGNGDGTWRLPIPARFVIDREGIVRAVDADPDYTRPPEPAHTVEVLGRRSISSVPPAFGGRESLRGGRRLSAPGRAPTGGRPEVTRS